MPTQSLQFGATYHIYNRGNNRENLFIQTRNYPYFMRLYAKYILPVAETFAYCLMPNHFHFLIRTRTEEEQLAQIVPFSENGPILKATPPSRAFNNLFIAYARAFNKATGRTGVLFETPFHRKLVDSDEYFRRLIVYIHKNPQKHGFVDDFREWQWSSYDALLSNKATRLERTAVNDWFGDRESFSESHLQEFDESEVVELVGEDA
jgi:putative transposase